MTFDYLPVRLCFKALDTVRFPASKAGNALRGAFGMTAPGSRLFRPAGSGKLPSGLADPPRPFVLRPRMLDARVIAEGERFELLVHLFDLRPEAIQELSAAFREAAASGFGPGRGRALLEDVHRPVDPVRLPLRPTGASGRFTIEFLSPTALKPPGPPAFAIVFGRARDRVSTLRALYGPGPLDMDFRGLGERARAVRLLGSELEEIEVQRKSSRTGHVHGIGGFTGVAEYLGDAGEFLPMLRAAEVTGIGRHTVWGNGEIRVHEIPSVQSLQET